MNEDLPPVSGIASGVPTGCAQLVAARERMGLSVADVAQRIKLHRRQLEAIERGDWESLPGMAFARGSVRSYARLVGVDPTALLAAMGGYESLDTLQEKPSLGAPMPRGGELNFGDSRRFRRLPWALLGLAGVIALAVLFGRSEWSLPWNSAVSPAPVPSEATVQQAPSTAPLAVPAPPQAESAGANAAAAPATAADTRLPPAPGVPALAAPVTTGAANATESARPVPAAGTGLRIAVRQDSWVEVRDPSGRTLHMGLVKPGAALEIAGQGPFVYTIGNANQADMTFGGRVVDLKPVTAMPANIAKGRLP